MGEPARGYSWQPFAPGHTASLKHGADSPRNVAPVAAELVAWLHDVAPWTRAATYDATVEAWAWAEARARLVRRWLDEHETVNEEGDVPNAATYLERIESRAENLRARLGLDPMSMVKLLAGLTAVGGEAAADALEELKREGRQLIAGWRELTPGPDADDDQDQEVTP